MKILCLVDLLGASSGQDFSSDLKSIDWKTEAHVLAALKALGHERKLFGIGNDIWPLLDEIQRFRPDVVFNLCEAFAGDRSLESSIPNLLSMLGIPFTGCSAQILSFCKEKTLANAVAAQSGVRVPKQVIVRKNEKLNSELVNFFPAFVKPCSLESSQGLSLKSKVTSIAKLTERVAHLHKKFNQDVLVQEYVDGRELYVSALCVDGNITALFPARELHFGALGKSGQGFATYRGKWDEEYRKKWKIYSRPAHRLSYSLEQELHFATTKICAALKITGYIRLDFRVSSLDGKLYFLEINPNPALARDDEFALAAKAFGLSYTQLISAILQLSAKKNVKHRVLSRHERRLNLNVVIS